MLADCPRVARSRLSNGAGLLPSVDGRSAVARRYRDIFRGLLVGAGPHDPASEQLARRFAALSIQAEQLEADMVAGRPVDGARLVLIASTLVRLRARLGVGKQRARA
jgi:hypothetical protein